MEALLHLFRALADQDAWHHAGQEGQRRVVDPSQLREALSKLDGGRPFQLGACPDTPAQAPSPTLSCSGLRTVSTAPRLSESVPAICVSYGGVAAVAQLTAGADGCLGAMVECAREMVWCLGVVILLLIVFTAHIDYVLPWGQMSSWGATSGIIMWCGVGSCVSATHKVWRKSQAGGNKKILIPPAIPLKLYSLPMIRRV